ncbi:MAG: GlsB/YeaQ/YmgE family stress response membrane protein [Terriglobales bacterium]
MLFLLWWIIVGLIAGWVTGKIMHSHRGAWMDIVVGIIGAIIGGWIMSALGVAARGGMIYTILVAILGAIVLTLIVRAFEHVRPRPGGTTAAPRM